MSKDNFESIGLCLYVHSYPVSHNDLSVSERARHSSQHRRFNRMSNEPSKGVWHDTLTCDHRSYEGEVTVSIARVGETTAGAGSTHGLTTRQKP